MKLQRTGFNKTPAITTSTPPPPRATVVAGKKKIYHESDSGKENFARGAKEAIGKINEFSSKCQRLKSDYITGMCILEQTGNPHSNRKHICH